MEPGDSETVHCGDVAPRGLLVHTRVAEASAAASVPSAFIRLAGERKMKSRKDASSCSTDDCASLTTSGVWKASTAGKSVVAEPGTVPVTLEALGDDPDLSVSPSILSKTSTFPSQRPAP